MMKFTKVAMASLLILGVSASSLQADSGKGLKYYSKKIKESCGGLSGADFAAKHSQMEWFEINEDGKMLEEIEVICPGVKVKEKYVPHLYEFSYEYANDSGNVPSC
ncbi:MAG: cytochrome C [Campylobacterota bacterium]|nr:cytochrome C [Campylobacterota bacterium]